MRIIRDFFRRHLLHGSLAALLLLQSLPVFAGEAPFTGETSSALDAFYALTGSAGEASDTLPHKEAALDLLQEFISGQTASLSSDPLSAQESLTLLTTLSDTDLTSFASESALPSAYVRSEYYKALASLLQIMLEQAAYNEGKYQELARILKLFLIETSDAQSASVPDANTEKEHIRASLTSVQSAQIAAAFELPLSFVEYIIMEEGWNSDDWTAAPDWSQIRAAVDAQNLPAAAGRADNTAASGAFPFTDIQIGSRDESGAGWIREMQEALIRLGYLSGSADGIFGPRTQAALIEYQLANGLHPSGAYRYTDYISLRSPEAVPRTVYSVDFWDEDSFAAEEHFEYLDYLDNLYDDDDRFEYDDTDNDDRFEYDDTDNDDRFEYDGTDDDDRFGYDDTDDDDRFEYDDSDDGFDDDDGDDGFDDDDGDDDDDDD